MDDRGPWDFPLGEASQRLINQERQERRDRIFQHVLSAILEYDQRVSVYPYRPAQMADAITDHLWKVIQEGGQL